MGQTAPRQGRAEGLVHEKMNGKGATPQGRQTDRRTGRQTADPESGSLTGSEEVARLGENERKREKKKMKD